MGVVVVLVVLTIIGISAAVIIGRIKASKDESTHLAGLGYLDLTEIATSDDLDSIKLVVEEAFRSVAFDRITPTQVDRNAEDGIGLITKYAVVGTGKIGTKYWAVQVQVADLTDMYGYNLITLNVGCNTKYLSNEGAQAHWDVEKLYNGRLDAELSQKKRDSVIYWLKMNLSNYSQDVDESDMKYGGLTTLHSQPDDDTIIDINHIVGRTGLREVDFSGCSNLFDISALRNLPNLQEANFAGCRSLMDISPLLHASNLKSLVIVGCPLLTESQIIQLMRALPECIIKTDF